MNRAERIVVVGAGLAGLRSAERLREKGFEGEIVIIGQERTPPYHRPALSKQLLNGTMRPNDLMLPAYQDVGAKWRLNTPVQYLLPHSRVVHLPGGEEIKYDGLIIASGVEARRQNGVPYHDPRVLVMRTLPDALDLERAISSSRGPVAVIGGGFTGCEIAASLRHMDREVTLIGRSPNLLGNVLGPALGEWLTGLHGDHGVDLALGTSVKQWHPRPEGIGLQLADGTTMLASCVVLATGTVPSTSWLRGSGLPLDDGVVCEPTCHVVGAEDVVAAGDVAQWPNVRFDDVPRRIEHWLNAIEMGRAAAENLLAGRAASDPFTPMPRFWTEQYGVRIQAAGVPKLGKDIVALGSPDDGTGTVFGYAREGRLMGVVGVDCPSSVLSWTDSVARQNPVPKRGLPAAASEATPGRTAPATPATPGLAAKRRGKHSLPAKDKPARREEQAAPSMGYLEPAANGGPVQSSARLRPADSRGRIQPVGGASPVDPTGLMPVLGPDGLPVDQSQRLQPVGAGRPAEPGGRMQPARMAAPAPATTGRIAPVGPADSARLRPVDARMAPGGPRPGPEDSYTGMSPAEGFARYLEAQSRPGRGPEDSYDRMPPAPPGGRGPADSFDRMPPVRPGGPVDSYDRMPPARPGGPADSFDRMPPVRPGGPADPYDRMPPARPGGRGPEDSFGRMPPVGGPLRAVPGGRGPADSFGRMPAVGGPLRAVPGGRGPGDSFDRMPPVQGHVTSNGRPVNGHLRPVQGVGPADSHGRLPAVDPRGRGPADSFDRMPPVDPRGRGPQDSFDRMPAVDGRADYRPPRRVEGAWDEPAGRHSADDGYDRGDPPPLSGRLGPADSYGRLPPVDRRGPADAYDQLPPADPRGRGPAELPPADPRGPVDPRGRGPADSYDRMPPARRGGRPGPADSYDPRGASDSYDRMPPVRPSGPLGPVDSNGRMRPVRTQPGGRRRRG